MWISPGKQLNLMGLFLSVCVHVVWVIRCHTVCVAFCVVYCVLGDHCPLGIYCKHKLTHSATHCYATQGLVATLVPVCLELTTILALRSVR